MNHYGWIDLFCLLMLCIWWSTLVSTYEVAVLIFDYILISCLIHIFYTAANSVQQQKLGQPALSYIHFTSYIYIE